MIDGPVSANGYTWWQIEYSGGYVGWAAGEYLALDLVSRNDSADGCTPSVRSSQISLGPIRAPLHCSHTAQAGAPFAGLGFSVRYCWNTDAYSAKIRMCARPSVHRLRGIASMLPAPESPGPNVGR